MTKLSDLMIVPLRQAAFCVQCEVICNESGHLCPICKTPSLFGLAQVMDRLPEPQVAAAQA